MSTVTKNLTLTSKRWKFELEEQGLEPRHQELMTRLIDNYVSGLPAPVVTMNECDALKRSIRALTFNRTKIYIFSQPAFDEKREPLPEQVRLRLGSI